MKFVMNFSGGLCSWFAARRLVDRHGPDRVTLLFADTNYEDADLYRFLEEASADIGVPITRVADGRTPWDLFFDQKFIGNSRIDICSRVLKRELLDSWCNANCDPRHTLMCVGLSHDERGRYLRFKWRMRARGWRVAAPAMSPPYATKADMATALADRGIDLPDLYHEGFPHNNCGGRCVKQGQAGWRLLLAKRRESYLEVEHDEERFRKMTGKNVSIMRDRSGGTTKPLTLRVFREKIENGQLFTADDWGGCGCAIE